MLEFSFQWNLVSAYLVSGLPQQLSGVTPLNAGGTGDTRLLGQEDDALEEEMASTPVLLPGEAHGQRSLVGYSPWDHKVSDTTE